MKSCLLLSSLFFLGACTGMPSAIKDFPAVNISYQLVSQNPETYRDTPIRWGGTIIAVENETDSSLIQVLYYPLGSNGHPQTDKLGEGRFAVEKNKFLDPAIFTKDTEITVTGIIKGSIERTIGNKILQFPLVSAETIYFWPRNYQENRLYRGGRYHYMPSPYPGYYGYPFFFEGFYDPYRYWW